MMVNYKVGCRFKNLKTGAIKDLWLTKREIESVDFEYTELNGWEQIGYKLNTFGKGLE